MEVQYNLNYNKVGIGVGLIGLVPLLVLTLLFFWFGLSNLVTSLVIFSTIVAIPCFITTLILGFLSLKIGNKKKGALLVGLAYILYFTLLFILLFGFSTIKSFF